MKNERDEDMLKNEDVNKTMQDGSSIPNIRTVEGVEMKEGETPSDQVGGVKPNAGGRQGNISTEDGGQVAGSSAGSH